LFLLIYGEGKAYFTLLLGEKIPKPQERRGNDVVRLNKYILIKAMEVVVITSYMQFTTHNLLVNTFSKNYVRCKARSGHRGKPSSTRCGVSRVMFLFK
jgi:hypothetical protein